MKRILALLLAFGLLVSSGSVASLSAGSDEDLDDLYVSWGELLPPMPR